MLILLKKIKDIKIGKIIAKIIGKTKEKILYVNIECTTTLAKEETMNFSIKIVEMLPNMMPNNDETIERMLIIPKKDEYICLLFNPKHFIIAISLNLSLITLIIHTSSIRAATTINISDSINRRI